MGRKDAKINKIYFLPVELTHYCGGRRDETNDYGTFNKCRVVTNEGTENTTIFMILYLKVKIAFLKIF